MENPLELEAPTDPIDRIHAYARDLAYGFILSGWVTTDANKYPGIASLALKKYLNNAPTDDMLFAFGYIQPAREDFPAHTAWTATQKALDLLERPATLPNVFIAYGRQESSAFGLACEYRLRSLGFPYLSIVVFHSATTGRIDLKTQLPIVRWLFACLVKPLLTVMVCATRSKWLMLLVVDLSQYGIAISILRPTSIALT